MTSKRVNWTEKEEEALMTEVNQRRDVIEGKFKRQGFPGGVTQKAKTAAWEEIHEALASQFNNVHRTTEQLIKKYNNIRYKARLVGSAYKKVPTGGGPPPPEPTPAEAIWLQGHDGSTTIGGIDEGFDTADAKMFNDLQFQYSANTCLDLTAARVVDVNADDLPHLFGNDVIVQTLEVKVPHQQDQATSKKTGQSEASAIAGTCHQSDEASVHQGMAQAPASLTQNTGAQSSAGNRKAKSTGSTKRDIDALRIECLQQEKATGVVVKRKEELMCRFLELGIEIAELHLKRMRKEEH